MGGFEQTPGKKPCQVSTRQRHRYTAKGQDVGIPLGIE